MKKLCSRIGVKILLTGFFGLVFTGCKKEDAVVVNVAIGDTYNGGKVAYILQKDDPGYDPGKQHGLIAAPIDQSIGIEWSFGLIAINKTSTELGKGNENTNAIVASEVDRTTAAKVCADLTLGGFSDWYLPSKEELHKLYLNKTAIGDFANYRYWSSTEQSNNTSWREDFGLGQQAANTKTNKFYVRAIRAF